MSPITLVLSFVVIGIFLLPVLFMTNIVFCVTGVMVDNKGAFYRYPVTLRLVK